MRSGKDTGPDLGIVFRESKKHKIYLFLDFFALFPFGPLPQDQVIRPKSNGPDPVRRLPQVAPGDDAAIHQFFFILGHMTGRPSEYFRSGLPSKHFFIKRINSIGHLAFLHLNSCRTASSSLDPPGAVANVSDPGLLRARLFF